MAEDEAADQTPPAGENLEAIIQKMNDDFNKRFQGFQGILDRRDAEYRQMLEDLQTSNLEPEEKEQAQASKLQKELGLPLGS